jgi:hypothetical protein
VPWPILLHHTLPDSLRLLHLPMPVLSAGRFVDTASVPRLRNEWLQRTEGCFFELICAILRNTEMIQSEMT